MSDERDIKSFSARYALQQIERSAKDLYEELRKLDIALDERVGVIRELKPCPLRAIVYSNSSHIYGSPEAAKNAAMAVLESAKEVEKENAAIAAENATILQRLKAIITNAGIKARVPVRRGRGRSLKTEWEDSDWAAALSHGIRTGTDWRSTMELYNRWVHECDSAIKAREEAVAATKRAEEARVAKLRNDLALAVIAERHGLPVDTPAYDVLSALLEKDKYLRLAHGMQLTRGDWSDGPWATKQALQDFVVVSDQDAAIAANIQSHLDDWDGDGRIFRDCEWNYGRVFGLVADKQLLADYETVSAGCY